MTTAPFIPLAEHGADYTEAGIVRALLGNYEHPLGTGHLDNLPPAAVRAIMGGRLPEPYVDDAPDLATAYERTATTITHDSEREQHRRAGAWRELAHSYRAALRTVRAHKPDHPIYAQPGPGGAYAYGCKRPDCDWYDVTRPTHGPDYTAPARATRAQQLPGELVIDYGNRTPQPVDVTPGLLRGQAPEPLQPGPDNPDTPDGGHVLRLPDALSPTPPDLQEPDPDTPVGPRHSDVGPPKTRDAADPPAEPPLPVVLDRLARAKALSAASTELAQGLSALVAHRAAEAYRQDGTDRWRRPLGSLITLTREADRIELDDPHPSSALADQLYDQHGVDVESLITTTVQVRQPDDLRKLAHAVDRLLDLIADESLDAVTARADDLIAVLDALQISDRLDPVKVLQACEQHLGATVTRDGTVVADTGEPIAGIRVVRGEPAGVQVRNDAELKAATRADVLAQLLG